ncbi:MAG: tetratricopeptide repeat protein [Desulfamplus sp.]|nr:tetratricopeptide repeat protein [Desulfamplus sp.]
MELLYKGSNFSSKEISFMKSGSDAIYHSDFTPNQYISDFLNSSDFLNPSDSPNLPDSLTEENDASNNQWLVQFNLFVKDILQTPDRPFTCFVIRFEFPDTSAKNNILNKDIITSNEQSQINIITSNEQSHILCDTKNKKETLAHALNASIIDEGGIWQWLCESTLIIVLWGDAPVQAEETIKDFIKFTDITLKIPCYVGAAVSPFMDFHPSTIVCNAVKALDHAAFFAPNSLIFFDDITQNIYGDRLYQLGKLEDAAKEYEQGLKIKGDNLNILNSLGVCYSLMNRLDLAREQFEKAITKCNELEYEYKESEHGLPKIEVDSNEPSKTNDNDPLKTDDNYFMFLYNAALTCNLMGDIENGIAYINKATAINKGFFEAELTAGILFFKVSIKNGELKNKQMADQALIHINNAVKLNPESAIAHRLLGELYLETNQPSKAVNEYKLALKINPYDASSMSGLARSFEIQNKNLDIALNLAIHSLEIAPDNPYFRTRLAKIYLKKGKYDFADIEFSTAERQFKAANIYLNKDDCKDANSPLAFSSTTIGTEEDIEMVKEIVEIDDMFEYSDNAKSEEPRKKSA